MHTNIKVKFTTLTYFFLNSPFTFSFSALRLMLRLSRDVHSQQSWDHCQSADMAVLISPSLSSMMISPSPLRTSSVLMSQLTVSSLKGTGIFGVLLWHLSCRQPLAVHLFEQLTWSTAIWLFIHLCPARTSNRWEGGLCVAWAHRWSGGTTHTTVRGDHNFGGTVYGVTVPPHDGYCR